MKYNKHNGQDSNQILLNNKDQQVASEATENARHENAGKENLEQILKYWFCLL